MLHFLPEVTKVEARRFLYLCCYPVIPFEGLAASEHAGVEHASDSCSFRLRKDHEMALDGSDVTTGHHLYFSMRSSIDSCNWT